MSLYNVKFNHKDYFVEADTFDAAVALWRYHMTMEWKNPHEGTMQPETVSVMHHGRVIRDENFASKAQIGESQT